MPGQLGVGVIGVGVLGRHHATNVAQKIPAARLVAVADVRPEVARGVAAELGAARAYATAQELTADPDIEAVVIASVDEAHAEGILAAAANRKDVFCEKPITTTLEDADAAIAAVERAGVRLQIGFTRRYDPAYLAAKRAIAEGRIGTPVFIKNAHRGKDPNPGPVRPAAVGCNPAVFVNSNIHDYDDARWLLGDEATEVTATGTRVVAPTAAAGVDVALSTVRFRGGALADFEVVIPARYGYDVRTEVIGDRGSLFIGSSQGTACVLATADGLRQEAMAHWLDRFGQAYLAELQDWVRRTRAGEPSPVTGADGRAALEIALAATRSFREARPISLPLA